METQVSVLCAGKYLLPKLDKAPGKYGAPQGTGGSSGRPDAALGDLMMSCGGVVDKSLHLREDFQHQSGESCPQHPSNSMRCLQGLPGSFALP